MEKTYKYGVKKFLAIQKEKEMNETGKDIGRSVSNDWDLKVIKHNKNMFEKM
jgi:hypothetical protein